MLFAFGHLHLRHREFHAILVEQLLDSLIGLAANGKCSPGRVTSLRRRRMQYSPNSSTPCILTVSMMCGANSGSARSSLPT